MANVPMRDLMTGAEIRKLRGDRGRQRPNLYTQPGSEYPGMVLFKCCRIVRVFKGDVWPCPTCGKRHVIER